VSSQRADDRPLSEDQAKELRRAALANAEALTSDARLLLDGNRFPRAGAVAIMVHEELAKWIALYTFSLRIVAGSTMDWTSFWNSWTNHRFKLELGIGADQTRAWYQKNQGTIPADQVQKVVAQAQEAIDKWAKQPARGDAGGRLPGAFASRTSSNDASNSVRRDATESPWLH
jgi:AbiV family abortive infection protein